MLVIDPTSHCDVCCEPFISLPLCIDCGHILCSNCLDAICEKTWSPRTAPACPFCRENFSKESARKLRIDLKTPRAPLKEVDDESDSDNLSQPSEAKRLEEKVARAAASKCSFEEVSELHKEIQQWLASEVRRTSASQHASLQLSAALLRAILLNCLAYSEASKAAKSVETSLKEKLDNATAMKEHLEVELQKHRTMYGQKVRECQDLRSELNRFKLTAPASASSIPRPSAPPPPTAIPARVSATPGPLSRMNSTASRASAMTPPPVPVTRQPYYPRSASTAPTSTHSRGMSTGSIHSSNTMASALKYQSSPLKSRVTASRASSPPLIDESNPPQRWLPNSDEESSNERRFQSPSPERILRSAAERTSISTASSSQARWYPRFHQPQDVV